MQIEPSLRASDADREQVAERLRHATAEGRLGGDELEGRLEALYAARTYGELDALVVDIPVSRSLGGQPRVRIRRLIGAVSAATLVLGVLGLLAVVRRHTAVAVLGPGRPRRLNLPDSLVGHHHRLIVGASLGVGVFVVLLASAALMWALMAARSRRH